MTRNDPPRFCTNCGALTAAEARAERRANVQGVIIAAAIILFVVGLWAIARIGSAPSRAPAAVVPGVSIQPTIEVRAVIEWPTATATATPVPTSTQRAVWQPDPCSTPEPGKLCRVPDRQPPTPTPYPSCYGSVEPGKWCRWIVADDAPDGRSEVK